MKKRFSFSRDYRVQISVLRALGEWLPNRELHLN
jgi:hypothetical protein